MGSMSFRATGGSMRIPETGDSQKGQRFQGRSMTRPQCSHFFFKRVWQLGQASHSGLTAAGAAWADSRVFNSLQEGFLFESVLVLLFNRLGGADDQVDQDAGEKQNRRDQNRQNAHEGITRCVCVCLDKPKR